MAMIYTPIPDDFLEEMGELSDAEYGRFIRWLQHYKVTGETLELRGNERFYAKRGKMQIDRYIAHYNERVEKNRENGAKGGQATAEKRAQQSVAIGSDCQQSVAIAPQNKTKTKSKTKASKDALSPLPPFPGGWSETFAGLVRDWFSYKTEKRQGYKATGAKQLITKIDGFVTQYGESAVSDVITRSMAANYQGIVWDWLKRPQKPEPKPVGTVPKNARKNAEWMRQMLAQDGGEADE